MQFIQIVIYIYIYITRYNFIHYYNIIIITILINKAFVYKLPVILQNLTDNMFQKLKDI